MSRLNESCERLSSSKLSASTLEGTRQTTWLQEGALSLNAPHLRPQALALIWIGSRSPRTVAELLMYATLQLDSSRKLLSCSSRRPPASTQCLRRAFRGRSTWKSDRVPRVLLMLRRFTAQSLARHSSARSMSLYPPIQPYKAEYLAVSDVHEISVKQYGNAEGAPVLFVHGGPVG